MTVEVVHSWEPIEKLHALPKEHLPKLDWVLFASYIESIVMSMSAARFIDPSWYDCNDMSLRFTPTHFKLIEPKT